MGAVCTHMLIQFSSPNDPEAVSNNFDLYNLMQGLEWARGWLEDGLDYYDAPSIGRIDFRWFIKWAKYRIKHQLYLPHLKVIQ